MGLKEQESLQQLIWDECGIGFFQVDKNLTIVSANPKAASLCCLTAEAVIDKNLADLLEASIDFSIVLSHFATALSGEKASFTAEGVFPEGYLCLDFTLIPLAVSGEPHLIVQFLDVTKSRREEDNLERLMNLSEEMVAVIGPEGYFTRVNEAWTKVLGWDSDDLLSVPWKNYVHSDDEARSVEYFEKEVRGDRSAACKLRFQAEDNTWHWLELRSISDRVADTTLVVARDITADELLKQQIAVSEKNYRTIFDSATDMIVVLDASKGLVLDANKRIHEKLQCGDDAFYSEGVQVSVKGERVTLFSVLTQSDESSFEARILGCKGGGFPVLIDTYEAAYNGRSAIICIIRDITEQKLFEQELQRLAVTDSLTGLENRRAFYRAGESEFERYRRYRTGFSLAMVDIDLFKKVNDTYGHDVGDVVLKEVSALLVTSLRKLDRVYRYGGEEFLVILPNTSAKNSATVCDRMRELLEQKRIEIQEDKKLSCTISIGISAVLESDESIDQVLKRADEALYESKEMGRNRVTVS